MPTRRAAPLSLALTLLTACGGSEPASTEVPSTTTTPSHDESATTEWLLGEAAADRAAADEAAADEAAADEAAAIARADAFVRAQGYLDTPPSGPESEIVHEGIEGTLADRLNMLEPRAVHAAHSADGWQVVFRYRDPQYAGRGRMLILPDVGTPHFVHQDVLVP